MTAFAHGARPNQFKHYRYEIKMPLDRIQLEQFMPFLYSLGLYPRAAFPDRRINSVYYDTFQFDDYSDNVSGIGDRRKTRIRWYNGDTSKLTFEQKIKKNKASTKHTFGIKNPDRTHPASKMHMGNLLLVHDGKYEARLLRSLYPALEVQYDRQYFELSTDLRMTIDTGQKFKRLYPVSNNSFIDSPVYAVIEFKYPMDLQTKVRAMLKGLPFRIFRHSKYVIGIDCTAQ